MVVRAEEFGPPEHLTEDDFREVCGSFKITGHDKSQFEQRLRDLIDAYRQLIPREDNLPTRQEDAKFIRKAGDQIHKARVLLLRPLQLCVSRATKRTFVIYIQVCESVARTRSSR
jgi:hypothetical protein